MSKNYLVSSLAKIKELSPRQTKRLDPIFSDKVGIVNAILSRSELGKYGFHMFQSLSAHTKILFDTTREVSSGGLGINTRKDKALIACIAEAVERYCMSYVDSNSLSFCYWDELDSPHRTNNFHLYSNRQYKGNKIFSNPKNSKIYWTKVFSFKNKEKYICWPASLIYLPFDKGKLVAETTSTGVACHSSLRVGIMSGLLELIERDAVMINFMQRLNPSEIEIGSISGRNKQLIEKVTKKYKIRIYKLHSDIAIPIFLGFIWTGEGSALRYGIGACAHLSSEEALHKMLKECLFTYFYSKSLMKLRQPNPAKIKSLYEHYLYYQGNNFSSLLFKKSKIIKYSKKKHQAKELFDFLSKNNLDVYYKEITTSDVRPTGLKVVKVIVPGLIDLNKTHLLRREGATRFWSVPKKLKLRTKKKLYPLPHPFP